MARIVGTYEQISTAGETVNAFVPAPLPPRILRSIWMRELSALLQRAEAAIERLKLAGTMVPSLEWLLYSFVRKEAVVSSQIEGTQATLVDLLMYEAARQDGHRQRRGCVGKSAIMWMRSTMRASRCEAKMACRYPYGSSMKLTGG